MIPIVTRTVQSKLRLCARKTNTIVLRTDGYDNNKNIPQMVMDRLKQKHSPSHEIECEAGFSYDLEGEHSELLKVSTPSFGSVVSIISES